MANGQTLPFHEAIIGVIDFASRSDLKLIARLLKKTYIPKGHDEIIEAWNKRIKEMYQKDVGLDIPEYLIAKKQEIADNANVEGEGVDLEKLQDTAEKLVNLLKQNESGLMSWNDLLDGLLKDLFKMLSAVYNK